MNGPYNSKFALPQRQLIGLGSSLQQQPFPFSGDLQKFFTEQAKTLDNGIKSVVEKAKDIPAAINQISDTLDRMEPFGQNSIPEEISLDMRHQETISEEHISQEEPGHELPGHTPAEEKLFIMPELGPVVYVKARNSDKLDSNVSRKHVPYVLAWFFFSIMLALFNKNMLDKNHWNGQFPLLLASFYSAYHYILSSLLLKLFPQLDTPTANKTRELLPKNPKLKDGIYYLKNIIPCGLAVAIEICTSNIALSFVPLSFYTLLKYSTPVFIILFAVVFGLERFRLSLVSIIAIISSGVSLFVLDPPKIAHSGFTTIFFASIASGLRWPLTEVLYRNEKSPNSPIKTIRLLSPIAFFTSIILSFCLENFVGLIHKSPHFASLNRLLETFVLVGIGATLAFLVLFTELRLLRAGSNVTLGIPGITKDAVLITISMFLYGDQLNILNFAGFIISAAGVYAYHVIRQSNLAQEYLPLYKSDAMD
ncbi:uncharacterized protein VTP21DRAFT_370 [Calcarisporiella thermophila]|uniref:uncharacterized protein n=1 Tax=Calcarisporiella thermophila TaxID=911321 RepID=UPI003742F223